jgi:hypothetical protein
VRRVAFLYCYRLTHDVRYLHHFLLTTNYTLRTFSGSKRGGWYGYADRAGVITQHFVGGAYKGTTAQK